MRQGINARGLRSDFEDYRNGRITYRELCDKIDNPGNRRAENRILRDMDRLDMPKVEPEKDEGGFWPTVAMLVLAAFFVFVCCAVPGCGTIHGFGNDLSEWSDGIRGSVQADAERR